MRFPARARLLAALAFASVPLAWATPARADVSSWMSASAGAMSWKQSGGDYTLDPSLQFDVGVGTTPTAAFIFGGVFRVTPILGAGTDLGLLLRGATRGYQEGGFGIALDAGGYARFWGVDSAGFLGSATLGAPLGLTLTLQAAVGTDSAVAFGGVLGIDFLRLTVYRQTLLDAWPNPYPAQQARRYGAGTFRF